MAADKEPSENVLRNLKDFSSVLKDLSLNRESNDWKNLRKVSSGDNTSPSPTKSTRSSLGILPPGALDNISVVDSVDGSIHFPKLTPDNKEENDENLPPTFFKPRFEIESGILDENGETDLENFLDDGDIKQLDDLYTPSSSADSESDASSVTSAVTQIKRREQTAGYEEHTPDTASNVSPVGPAARFIPPSIPVGDRDNCNYGGTPPGGNQLRFGQDKQRRALEKGSSSEELAVPLNVTYDSPKDQDVFVRPMPPGSSITPRAAQRPKPHIDTPAQCIPAALLMPNTSMNGSKIEHDNTPILPPRAPAGWGSFLEKSSMGPPSNQQSFNCSGFPWEQLVHKESPDASNMGLLGLADKIKEAPQQVNESGTMDQTKDGLDLGVRSKLPLEMNSMAPGSKIALETSAMEPLDPSFCSGKISARSTSLGPSGGIGDRTMDDNFSDFSKPPSFQSSYTSNYTFQDESVVHSGFPPIMSVSGEGSATAFKDQDGPFAQQRATQQHFNPFDSPFSMQPGQVKGLFQYCPDNRQEQAGHGSQKFSLFSGGDPNLIWQGTGNTNPLYNPFDVNRSNLTSQPVDEEFHEMDGDANLEDFLAKEEEECLQNHKFMQEEDMDKDSGDISMLSGISDKSIVLRNNGLWAGDTSQVDLDKLREETRLSRCQYFQLNSSRLGSLEDSIPETDRPHFGFVHKIRSPEHRPSPLLDDSNSDSSNRNTYDVVTPTAMKTPTIEPITEDQNNSELSEKRFDVGTSQQNSAAKHISNEGSCESSAESTYIQSGDSTKTIVSTSTTGSLKANELVDRLEALTDNIGTPAGPNISYPDVVEASFQQNRDLEKSLSSLVDGELNLSTISKALSDANLSLDPHQFVNLIKSTFKAKLASEADDGNAAPCTRKEENASLPAPGKDSASKSANQSTKKDEGITITPKTSLSSDSGGNVRRKLSDTSSPTTHQFTISENVTKNIQPLSISASAPVTPRDTPVPPLLVKATSVPNSMDGAGMTSTGRRRNPSGTRHSSPKKSPRKVVINNSPLKGLEDLLEEADHTPSMCVTSRKHLQTSTPFHPNMNLSSVIMDNLGKDKSISPFVNPDHSINAVNLDVSSVSPDLYSSILPAVQHVTPKSASGYTELHAARSTQSDQVVRLSQDIHIDRILSSHCWQVVNIPVVHNLNNDLNAVMKVTNIWIGSVEIPNEFWSQVLKLDSTETVVNVKSSAKTIDLKVMARREGAFALNIGLISPGGRVSSGIVRFQVEEPILRLLTRNGHTVDFGSLVHTTSSSMPVMLVNGGHADLELSVDIVTDSNLFSMHEEIVDKVAEFTIPGRKMNAGQDEGVGKEIKIWARTDAISKKHPEPHVYSGQLEIKLGGKESSVVLGRVQILVRVCFSSLVISSSSLTFTCAEGKKSAQKLEVKSEGSLPLDIEASADDNSTGIFIYEKKFKVFPGISKPFNIEFVAKPGCSGKNSGNLKFVMQPGNISYKIGLNTMVVSKVQDNLFSGNDSPGLKLGMMQTAVESLDRFPIDADRSLINWFAVEPGVEERQQINLRNSVSFAIDLNVLIRESEDFFLQANENSSLEQASKLHFKARETKVLYLVYKPKKQNPSKGKLVLKPVNVKIGGKIIKASINLVGVPGVPDIKILDLKQVEEAKFCLSVDQEPPVSRQFRITNQGFATGFVKIVCLETLGQKETDSQVIVAPSEFLIESGTTFNVTLTFGASYASGEANLAIFCGSELARSVYKRAKQLPGAVRLSGSPALLGVDFSKEIDGEEEMKLAYTGDVTPEDANHFFHKTEKLAVKVDLVERQANFQELGVEETLSETRLETTAFLPQASNRCAPSPPTPDCTKRSLDIIPQNITLEPGTEAIVKIINRTNDTVHWDLNWSSEYLNCSPPAGQLAKSAQAILLISTQPDVVIGPQGWRGQVEIFSEQTVEHINVSIKTKAASSMPIISVNPGYLDFGKSAVDCVMGKKVVSVTNTCQSLVQWKAVVSAADVFLVSQPAGILNPGQTVSISVSFKPVKLGPSTATLDFISQVIKGPGREVQSGIQPVTVLLRGEAVSLQQDEQQLTTNTDFKSGTSSVSNVGDFVPCSQKSAKSLSGSSIADKHTHLASKSVIAGAANPVAAAATRRSGARGTLSLESENICFGTVPLGRSQVAKVTVKNRTGESQMIHLVIDSGSPFSIIHNTLEVKSQSFSRVPVQFRPTSSGNFGALLKISSDSGWKLAATLSGSGMLIQENVTATL